MKKESLKLSGQNMLSNKHLVSVDIQPEYQDYFGFRPDDFTQFLNDNHENLSHLTFLYNGADTLGMTSEHDYKLWLNDFGLECEIIENADFIDKGYAFFRYCMDEGMDEKNIVNFVKFMMENNINDSRDLDKEMWNKYVEQYGDEDIRNLLENAGDMINIPDLIDDLRALNNIIITGGGINECFKEVEIALQALGKHYQTLSNIN